MILARIIAEVPNWLTIPGIIVAVFFGTMVTGMIYGSVHPPRSRGPRDPAAGLKRRRKR